MQHTGITFAIDSNGVKRYSGLDLPVESIDMATKRRGTDAKKQKQAAAKKAGTTNKSRSADAKGSANKVPRKGAKSGKTGGANAGGEPKKRRIHGGASRRGSRSNENK